MWDRGAALASHAELSTKVMRASLFKERYGTRGDLHALHGYDLCFLGVFLVFCVVVVPLLPLLPVPPVLALLALVRLDPTAVLMVMPPFEPPAAGMFSSDFFLDAVGFRPTSFASINKGSVLALRVALGMGDFDTGDVTVELEAVLVALVETTGDESPVAGFDDELGPDTAAGKGEGESLLIACSGGEGGAPNP